MAKREGTGTPEPVEPDEVSAVEDAPIEAAAGRIEVFEAVRPDGVTVTVTRNIDTGEQTVTE